MCWEAEYKQKKEKEKLEEKKKEKEKERGRHKTMKSMKLFKESQEAVIKVREKRVSLKHTAKQRTEK